MEAEFDFDGPRESIDPDRQIHVYRVVQGALTNVAPHADAASARVEVRRTDDGWLIRVLDDGVGLGSAPLEDGDGTRTDGHAGAGPTAGRRARRA